MTDLERLDEALEKFGAMTTPTGMYGYDHDLLIAAARAYRDLLANGNRVDVCVGHWHNGQANEDSHDLLTYCPREGSRESCRIVPKLLVDPTTEEDSRVGIQRILDEGKAQGPRDGGFIPDHPTLVDPTTEEER